MTHHRAHRRSRLTTALLLATAAALPLTPQHAVAQDHQHVAGMRHDPAPDTTIAAPPAGQAAFAAIAAVVKALEADPNTDWSRVDIERLRQHLIDMDEVVLRSSVQATNITGGARYIVTGAPRTAAAIRRMLGSHAGMLGTESGLVATVSPRDDGAVFTVTAADTTDARAAARIRGLGFAGLLTIGEHHAAHHLALARGDTTATHH